MPNQVGAEVASSGATPVTLVSAPGTGVRRTVVVARLNNRDTAVIDARIQHAKAATDRVVASDAALAVGGTITVRNVILDATDESLEIVLGGAVTTNELHGTAAYYDEVI